LADCHSIADFDGSFKQKNNASNEIGDYILQAEADANGKETYDYSQSAHIDSDELEGEKYSDDHQDIVTCAGQGILRFLVDVKTQEDLIPQDFLQ
jgi:hypothetical protein